MWKYTKAKMFNRKAARSKSKANEIIDTLKIQPGQTIADIGSGGGFFTFLFSAQVGQKGRVYAIDTNKDFLEFITQQATQLGYTNITTVLAIEQAIPLPPNSVDLIFVRNVFHHLQNRTQYFSEVKKLLTAKGRIVIIEYTPSNSRFSFHHRCGHHVAPEQIITEMNQAGLSVSASFDFLAEQSFTIFVQENKG
jgi:arsenite methyltransferase